MRRLRLWVDVQGLVERHGVVARMAVPLTILSKVGMKAELHA